MASEKMTGEVTKIVRHRGFFFVKGDDGLSRFVHATSMATRAAFDNLREGHRVSFVPIEAGPDRLRGVEVETL